MRCKMNYINFLGSDLVRIAYRRNMVRGAKRLVFISDLTEYKVVPFVRRVVLDADQTIPAHKRALICNSASRWLQLFSDALRSIPKWRYFFHRLSLWVLWKLLIAIGDAIWTESYEKHFSPSSPNETINYRLKRFSRRKNRKTSIANKSSSAPMHVWLCRAFNLCVKRSTYTTLSITMTWNCLE